MKKKSGHRRRTKVERKSRKNLRRTVKRKSLGKGRRHPTRRYSRVQRGGDRLTDNLDCFVKVGDNYNYRDGDLVHDYEMSFKLYKVAADRGHADAQYKLGEMFRYGIGVNKNNREAKKWYELAATQGHERAQYILGEIFERGLIGAAIDTSKAVQWYQLAADQRHKDAEAKLKSLTPPNPYTPLTISNAYK